MKLADKVRKFARVAEANGLPYRRPIMPPLAFPKPEPAAAAAQEIPASVEPGNTTIVTIVTLVELPTPAVEPAEHVESAAAPVEKPAAPAPAGNRVRRHRNRTRANITRTSARIANRVYYEGYCSVQDAMEHEKCHEERGSKWNLGRKSPSKRPRWARSVTGPAILAAARA